MSPTANYVDLIGASFEYGARGPDKFDCYGLVMEMHKRANISLPDFGFADDKALISAMMGVTMPQWREVKQAPGAVVLIRIGGYVSHVGYMIDQHQMIHTWECSGGVTVIRVDRWKQRIVGFYQYVGI